MSATNRGGIRKAYDFYATPIDVTEKFLRKYGIHNLTGNILEPSAGNGNIIKALRKVGLSNTVSAIEIREEEKENLKKVADTVILGNFLEMDNSIKYDVVIGNPPYSQAKEFVEKALTLTTEKGVVIMLLRTAFLESRARYEFWQNNPPTGLYVLSRRPSFTGKGTDATSYAWFVWDKKTKEQVIAVI